MQQSTVAKRAPGNMGTTGDGWTQLFFAAAIVAILMLLPANVAPVQAHDAPTTCSVSTNDTTGYKIVFVAHIKDGDAVYSQQNGVSKRIYRGHTHTNRAEPVSVHSASGWTEVCAG